MRSPHAACLATLLPKRGWVVFALVLPGLARADATAWLVDPIVGEVANVRNFGARGDGRADDTAAIQAALASPYLNVYVPGGVYKATGTLRIASGRRLTLAPDATILRAANSTAMLLNATDGQTANYAAATNVIVEGGTWDGNSTQFGGVCTLIAFGHASDVVIRDLTLKNIPVWHGIELNATRRATVERVRFENCDNESLQLDTMNSGAHEVFPWFGPYNDAICRDITIRDCWFENVITAVGTHSAPPVVNLTIAGCTVRNARGIALKPSGYVNMLVENCDFLRCQTVLAGSVNGFTLHDNRIFGSLAADLNLANCTNGRLEGNIFYGPAFGVINAGPTVLTDGGVFQPELPIQVPVFSINPPPNASFYYYQRGDLKERVVVQCIAMSFTPRQLAVTTGDEVHLLTALAGRGPFAYQWRKDGSAIAGATGPTFTLDNAVLANAGKYQVVVTNSAGQLVSAMVALAVAPPKDAAAVRPVLTNLAIRAYLPTANSVLTAGFVVKGASPRQLLVRGVGPTLRSFGVADAADQVELRVFDDRGAKLRETATWDPNLARAFTAVGAFAFGERKGDAALMIDAAPGPTTAQVVSSGGGTALVEVFDTKPGNGANLVNLAARGMVGSGEAVLSAGFTVAGSGVKRLLIRAVGPGLAQFGVMNAMSRPRIELYGADGEKLAEQEGWSEALGPVFDQVRAFALSPGSGDAAALVEVMAGTSHTIVLRGAPGMAAEVLLEIYDVP